MPRLPDVSCKIRTRLWGRRLSTALVLWFACGPAAATPDWQSAREDLTACLAQRSDSRIAAVAEDVALALEPTYFDHSELPPDLAAPPPARLSLLVTLVVFHARRGDLAEAERLYTLAFAERLPGGYLNSGRPINLAQRYLLLGYLRAGDSVAFAQTIGSLTDVFGAIPDQDGKLRTIGVVVAMLGASGEPVDQDRAASAVTEWISSQPEIGEEGLAQIVRSAVDTGLEEVARAIAGASSAVRVRDALDASIARLAGLRARSARLEGLASGPRPEEVFAALESWPDDPSAQTIRREFNHLALGLRQSGELDRLRALLLAARDHAETLDPPECGHALILAAMSHAAAIEDGPLLADLGARLPAPGGPPWTDPDARCEFAAMTDLAWQVEILTALGGGLATVTSIAGALPPSDFPNFRFDLSSSIRGVAPFLREDQVLALFERYAQLAAQGAENPAMDIIVSARFARSRGFDEVAFILAERGLNLARDAANATGGSQDGVDVMATLATFLSPASDIDR